MGFLDGHFGPAPVMLLTVPLLNRAGEAVGVLCVFLEGDAEEPSPERLALVEAFAGAGAAAIDNQRLLLIQKALLESLISLVASAIDSKSPYTGGHCQRVPELTKMLARAACDAKTGPYAQFDIDENGWEALHIAGWLHDCGKVTTPEYVVDKATKLETIYDRIHEIRMRFEVLKRDAEIACLKAVAAGGDEPALRAALQAELRTLDEEFAFVAACNEGGEFMAPEKVARLKTIAARTWQRTLDSRLGVSRDEGKRRRGARPRRFRHRVPDGGQARARDRARAAGPDARGQPWRFKMKMPTNLYSRGEIYNLSIARGTLTEEERYKINDHIVQTIIMLTKLPFPKHLRSVPELAGGHHEKMDGTGYPKRLSAGDMSVQARIMAIADIFEALTASDRPYKKGKKLSEAIGIMARMKKEKHVDPDLFDLFLESGIYRTYAERYMEPQYIDAVDVGAHVGARA
jgi:HD-GYP domain-containing protein (c-di-GMP phosphodiesterase class II)